jgi:hypothetical protein
MTNTNILAIASAGSRALKNAKYEKYCRLRASALPRIRAYREVGWGSREDDVAYINACRLERRPEIQDRIGYLTRQEEDLVVEKRRRIEEQLWAIHEANIQDLFEICEQPKATKDGEIETDQNGQMRLERKERPRLISDLAPEVAQLIEDVTVDSKGRAIPKLYSKLQASRELRAMLNIGRPERVSDISRLSDAELIAQLSDTAKELGIEISLNYSFAQPKEPEE